MTASEFPRATLPQWEKAAAKSARAGDLGALNGASECELPRLMS